MRRDEVTGNIYQRAREYNPRLGRFLQRDPLGYPDGMNTYAAYHVLYGGVDPSGLGYVAGASGGGGGAGHSIPNRTNPNDVTSITQTHDGKTEIEFRHQKDRREQAEWAEENPEAAAAANEKYWSDMRDTFGVLGETVGSFCPGAGEVLDSAVLADPDSSWWEKGLAGASLGLSLATAGTSPNIGGVLRAGDEVAEAAGGAKVTGQALADARKEFNRTKPKFWKNEASANAKNYSKENLERMSKGKAPIGSDGHSMELHHKKPLSEGGSNDFDNLEPMTKTDHRLGDNYKKNHPNCP